MRKILILFSLFSFFIFSALSLPSCFQKKSGGVWRSDDAGEIWNLKSAINAKQNISQVGVIKMVFDPGNFDRIYIGTEARGLFVSEDNAETWQATKISTGDIWDIAINPKDPKNIYVSVFYQKVARIYKTVDQGLNWELIFTDSILNFPIYNVIIDWSYPDRVLITTGWGGVLKSEDQGKTWAIIDEFKEPGAKIGRLYQSKKDSNLIWYVTSIAGIYKSEDKGDSWREIALSSLKNINASATQIYQLEIDYQGERFFIATNYGLLLGENFGSTWRPINTLIPFGSLPFYAVAINPVDSNELFFVAGDTVYKSINQGETWRVRKVYTGQFVRILKYSPQNPAILYLGIRGK